MACHLIFYTFCFFYFWFTAPDSTCLPMSLVCFPHLTLFCASIGHSASLLNPSQHNLQCTEDYSTAYLYPKSQNTCQKTHILWTKHFLREYLDGTLCSFLTNSWFTKMSDVYQDYLTDMKCAHKWTIFETIRMWRFVF